MHELSIATNISEAVTRVMTERGLGKVSAIGLRIGDLSGVDPEALRFGFEVITKETALDGTALEIVAVPVAAKCRACGTQFDVENYLFVCPSCGNSRVDVIRGMELEIAYLETDAADNQTEETP